MKKKHAKIKIMSEVHADALLLISCVWKRRMETWRQKIKKKKKVSRRGEKGTRMIPGPRRTKCVWCSTVHAHRCQTGKCYIRDALGGIGSNDMLCKVRELYTSRVVDNATLKRAVIMGPSVVDHLHGQHFCQ